MEAEVFQISTEILGQTPFAVGVGFACSCFVVLAAGLLVSGVKTFFKIVGGR